MFKKIVILLGLFVIVGAFGAYFYYAESLTNHGKDAIVCNTVDIKYLDSLKVRLIDEQKIKKIVINTDSILGQRTDKINLDKIEKVLNSQGEISNCEAYISQLGVLSIDVAQRKPIIRFENDKESYYADQTGYLFPTLTPVQVPIVSGCLPTSFGKQYKGYPDDKERDWIMSIISLSEFIENKDYYKRLISEIYIEPNGDISLFPRIGCEKILFGNSSDIAMKFKKIDAFYQTILPTEGESRYKVINIKYNNQIICK